MNARHLNVKSLPANVPTGIVPMLVQRLLDWQKEREAVRHLQSLPDELLYDIGIVRDDIVAAVRGRAERSADGWMVAFAAA
ncbi:MAG TPA: DUF1127 domain-containing protein [Alphaproteobacteria bacterium]|nr:DUF1127 domain-containing protein [Alphaproteobacteria bacterium]